MRHLNKGRSLSRSTSHRKALLNNLAQELFQHKRIRTTLTKARELRPFAEKLVTTAKKGHIAARRHVLRYISRKSVVKNLFDEIAPSFADRNGGYTRIIKMNPRVGDNAPLAIIELVGYEGVKATASSTDSAKAKPAKKASGTKAKSKPRPKGETGDTAKKAKPKAESKAKGKTATRRKTGEK